MKTTLVKVDSRALQQYFKNDEKSIIRDKNTGTNKVVNIPNNKVLTSSFNDKTPVSLVLSKITRDANVFKDFHSVYLISLG